MTSGWLQDLRRALIVREHSESPRRVLREQSDCLIPSEPKILRPLEFCMLQYFLSRFSAPWDCDPLLPLSVWVGLLISLFLASILLWAIQVSLNTSLLYRCTQYTVLIVFNQFFVPSGAQELTMSFCLSYRHKLVWNRALNLRLRSYGCCLWSYRS